MRGVIYAIGNKVNGKIYIGKSATLTAERRWKYHLWDAARGKPWPIHRAIRKYGAESFVLMTLHSRIRTEERLNLLERKWIRELKANDRKIGYNLTEGGDGITGFKFSLSSRRKMSRSMMGNTNTPKGRKQSPEHLEKRRIAMLGNTNGRKV